MFGIRTVGLEPATTRAGVLLERIQNLLTINTAFTISQYRSKKRDKSKKVRQNYSKLLHSHFCGLDKIDFGLWIQEALEIERKGEKISRWKKSIPKTIRKTDSHRKIPRMFQNHFATFWDLFWNYGQIVSNVTLVDESYVSISYTASAGTLLAFANDITQFFCVFLKRKQWTQAKRKKK